MGKRVISSVVLITLAGCSVYDSSLIENGSAGVPSRPSPETSSPDDSESVVFALKDIFIRQSPELASRIGIDLDGTMTTSREDATCEPRMVDGEVVAIVDGNKGIDNSSLLPAVGSELPCLEDNLALTQGRGVGTIILWVRGWNGQRDDANVTAMLTTAVDGTNEDPSLLAFRGGNGVDLAYAQGSPDSQAPDPAWEGEDWWYLDPADFEADETGQPSSDLPKVEQVDGYVAYGRLVLPLPDGSEFKLIAGDGSIPSDGAMTVVVNGGFMLGDISEDHTRLEHGLFTGRFSIDKLGEATPSIGMCEVNASVIETLFGQFADIRQFAENDGTGAECDAFSLGVTFVGVIGRVAGLAVESRPALEPCAEAAVAPLDRCCPSQWLEGELRSDTCDSPEKLLKAERFDALPSTLELPVPVPDFL